METSDDTLDIFIEAQDTTITGTLKNLTGQLKSNDGCIQAAIGQRALGYKGEGRDVWWIHVLCTTPGTFTLDLFVWEDTVDSVRSSF
jgi:hypothetical protein